MSDSIDHPIFVRITTSKPKAGPISWLASVTHPTLEQPAESAGAVSRSGTTIAAGIDAANAVLDALPDCSVVSIVAPKAFARAARSVLKGKIPSTRREVWLRFVSAAARMGDVEVLTATSQHVIKAAAVVPAPAGAWSLFSDGSCTRNPGGEGGFGYVLLDSSGSVIAEDWGYAPACTSNGMELRAISEGLRQVPHGQPVRVYSDSLVAISAAQRDDSKSKKKRKPPYHPLTAPDVIAARAEVARLGRAPLVTFEHVKGHSGIPGNERADALSNMWRVSAPGTSAEQPAELVP